MNKSAFERQVGGDHYRKWKIQPLQFVMDNGLPFAEGNAIKYICRHRDKAGEQDLRKAIHYIEMIIEREYGQEVSEHPCKQALSGDGEAKSQRDGPLYHGYGMGAGSGAVSGAEVVPGSFYRIYGYDGR